MPTIDSTATSKGKQRFKYVLYLADDGGADTYPAAKLLAGEPGAGWVKQGRLLDNSISGNFGDVEWFDLRAGFARDLQARVPRQAEDIRISCTLDENDPDVIAKIMGSTATSLSSGAYMGTEYVYKTGTYFGAKVLLVGQEVQGTREEHLFLGKAIVTFKPRFDDAFNGLDVEISGLDTSTTETIRYRQWD